MEYKKDQVLKTIYELIQKHPSGIHISSLELALNKIIPTPFGRRTLQRHLADLKAQGLITMGGGGNETLYFPAEVQKALETEVTQPEMLQTHAFSVQAQKIIEYIHQPKSHRKIVAYNLAFLDSYRPGETFYLPESLREQLRSMGQSRFPQEQGQRIGGTYVRNVYQQLLVDLSWASSHLEGNTYSRLETQNLIAFGQVASGKDLTETQMILNHKAAIEMLMDNEDRIGFDAYTFYTLHANLSYNLLPNPQDSGRLRQGPVEIWGTTYLPMAMPAQIESLFHEVLKKASEIPDPYEQSFFIMVHIPYLQPFIDVNKRVSRLGANISLIKNDLCPLSFIDIDEKAYIDGLLAIYELNKVEVLREVYTAAYERSCQKYAGIIQNMAEPQPIRLRYRIVIMSVVKSFVVQCEKPSSEAVEKALGDHPHQPEDHASLIQMILEEFTFLHEGNIGRYGITPTQYYKWRS